VAIQCKSHPYLVGPTPANFPTPSESKSGATSLSNSQAHPARCRPTVIANTLFHPFRDWSSSTVESAAANNLRNLFQYYRVLGAKLELRLYGTSTTAEQSMWVGVVPEFIGVGQSSSTTISKLTQSPRAKWLIAPAYVAGASAPKYQMSSYLTSATALGNTPMVAQADPSLTGLNNNSGDFGDPAALWQFSLIYQSGDATGTSNIGMDILLTQYVQFEGRAPGS